MTYQILSDKMEQLLIHDRKRYRIIIILSTSITVLLVYGIIISTSRYTRELSGETCQTTVGSGVLYFSFYRERIGRRLPGTNYTSVVVSPAVVYYLQMLFVINNTKDFVPDKSRLRNYVLPYKTRPAAHLQYNATSPTSGGSNLEWLKPQYLSASFTQMDMHFFNDSLRVPDSGLYLVYSAFTLRLQNLNQTILHRLNCKSTNGETRTVFQTTLQQGHKYMTVQTSVLWGNIHLQKNDVISPYITNTSCVYPMSIVNYWGAFKMNDVFE